MINFQTMPLRFRVWDIMHKKMYSDPTLEETFILVKRLGRTLVHISQQTGGKDDANNKLYFGDILNYVTEAGEIGVGYVSQFYGDVIIQEKRCFTYMTKVGERRYIGNIWENPELLEGGQ